MNEGRLQKGTESTFDSPRRRSPSSGRRDPLQHCPALWLDTRTLIHPGTKVRPSQEQTAGFNEKEVLRPAGRGPRIDEEEKQTCTRVLKTNVMTEDNRRRRFPKEGKYKPKVLHPVKPATHVRWDDHQEQQKPRRVTSVSPPFGAPSMGFDQQREAGHSARPGSQCTPAIAARRSSGGAHSVLQHTRALSPTRRAVPFKSWGLIGRSIHHPVVLRRWDRLPRDQGRHTEMGQEREVH